VNYADDFVILCRRNAAEAGEPMEAIMAKKIRVCRVPEESFEFLRYALCGMSFEPDGTQLYWHPSGKETCEVALRGKSACWRVGLSGQEAGELVGAITMSIRSKAGRQNVFRAAWTPATGSSDFQPAVGEGIKDPSPKAGCGKSARAV
jgi:RNA-directed DNA polymerase